MLKDYPKVGVCSWKAWTQEAACWMHDPRRGNEPVTLAEWKRCLRAVRQRPMRANPWRQCFARYAMTPCQASQTLARGAAHPELLPAWVARILGEA